MAVNEVYRGKFIRVTETDGPNGQIFEKATFRDGISVIIVLHPGKLRFIRENDPVREQDRVKLVSGYIEDGEEPLECARRELQQEAGITANTLELLHCYQAKGAIQKNQYFFVASGVRVGVAAPDENEMIYGHVDMTYEEAQRRALAGEFGNSESAYAILKFVLTR